MSVLEKRIILVQIEVRKLGTEVSGNQRRKHMLEPMVKMGQFLGDH